MRLTEQNYDLVLPGRDTLNREFDPLCAALCVLPSPRHTARLCPCQRLWRTWVPPTHLGCQAAATRRPS